ncbi:MAG: S-methyl-5-thioribose-1-phosphate isomerase [Chloroflexi bacterium HGW-Chloroflexi-1]|nr:MAG: S-methyl-5-thioribose-1-phosphate isomerase [Chloroflexi bacterium HGW-Chloroflexi-1]
MGTFRSIEWVNGVVRMLDQRQLPHKTVYLDYTDCQSVATAIRDMVIRGAPAIGAAAAYGLAVTAARSSADAVAALRAELETAADVLRAARPTAVNLSWAIDRVMARVADPGLASIGAIRTATLEEADTIAAEDVAANKQIGLNALPLIPDPANIIHHCNTGSLATVDYGTALGIIRIAHEHGKKVHAYLDETRPRLQGARLSAWECQQQGIPHTVIVDGASGHLMRTVGVDLCVVGADRVVANGDTANKIGTYNLALAAHAHGVPFYVAAPTSTIDLSISNGAAIEIEERPAREVTHVGETQITPDDTPVANFAFDVTPARYITAIITEVGIAYPPYEESLAALMAKVKA